MMDGSRIVLVILGVFVLVVMVGLWLLDRNRSAENVEDFDQLYPDGDMMDEKDPLADAEAFVPGTVVGAV